MHHCNWNHRYHHTFPHTGDFPPPPPIITPGDIDGPQGPGGSQGTTPSDSDWEKFQDIKENNS